LSGYDVSVTDDETLVALGALAAEARAARGENKKTAAARMGLNEGTLSHLERALTTRAPTRSTMAVVESYYGWRKGAMQEIWENRREIHAHDVSLAMMLPRPAAGLLKASHLTDQELMAELNFRFLMRDLRID
jgi:hypothetical protein